MGDATAVNLGVCNVTFNASDLGYTKGGVKISYKADVIEKTVDQEDAPLDKIVTKQTFEVTVPLAEADLSRFASLLPGAVYVLDSGLTKKKLSISGAGGVTTLSLANKLIIKPVGSEAIPNDWVTLFYAAPNVNLDFAYEKENVRVYNVVFKALKGVSGWVTFGDETSV